MTKFYRMIAAAPRIDRASRNAQGWLPERAARYCDAATLASGWGWYVYAPMAFRVVYDGASERLLWTYGEHHHWFVLGAAQFPNFAGAFDALAPADLQGRSPPLLTALPEPGLLQVWTGYFARSAPGYSLVVRAPANIPPHGDYLAFDGIIEADRFFAPVFANIRLTRSGEPVNFSMNKPLIQVQAVPRAAYAPQKFDVLDGIGAFSDTDWADYRAVVARRERAATYAIAARRRRKGEEKEP